MGAKAICTGQGLRSARCVAPGPFGGTGETTCTGEDDVDLPIARAPRMSSAPPHLRSPVVCVGRVRNKT